MSRGRVAQDISADERATLDAIKRTLEGREEIAEVVAQRARRWEGDGSEDGYRREEWWWLNLAVALAEGATLERALDIADEVLAEHPDSPDDDA